MDEGDVRKFLEAVKRGRLPVETRRGTAAAMAVRGFGLRED